MLTIPRHRNYSALIGATVGLCVLGVSVYTLTSFAESVPPDVSAKPVTAQAELRTATSQVGSTAISWPLKGVPLYNDGHLIEQGRPTVIASQQVATWLGDWSHTPGQQVHALATAAAAQHALPTVVLYNIPGRDCGQHSAGGAKNSDTYRQWLQDFTSGLGQLPALVVLEPDALPQMNCLSKAKQQQRIDDMAYAVDLLTSKTRANVYIDAGNSSWKDVNEAAALLRRVGVEKAAGFSLNVSGFDATPTVTSYGDRIAAAIGGKHYIVDTSRNGKGTATNNAWCNPAGRGLGTAPTTSPKNGAYADAYLWIKTPGESDGSCNGGPPAGQWFEAYAQALIANATP